MGEIIKKLARYLNFVDDLVVPCGYNILLIDNSCDQSIININSFLFQYTSGV